MSDQEQQVRDLFRRIAEMHASAVQAGIDELRVLMTGELAGRMDDPAARPFTEGYMQALESVEKLIRVGT